VGNFITLWIASNSSHIQSQQTVWEQFVVVTVYEKGLKISKVVIKVPTQFVVTVYEKSLKIAKAVIKVPTQFVVVTDYHFGYLQTLLIYSHHNKLCGNLDYRFGYIQTLLIDSQSGNQGSHTVCCGDCI
jgi:hypothetical protein